MLSTVKHLFFIVKNIFINYINYKFCRRSKKDCLLNLSNSLSNENILYSKLFQVISLENCLLDSEDNYVLNHFNDNVRYSNDEIYDIEELINELNNDNHNKIILKNIHPINSGLVSVVYDAEFDNKDVIIKVLRKNVKEKLENDLNEIEKIINIISKFPILKNYNMFDVFLSNKQILLNQTNFIGEVNNITKFYKNYENVDYIKIPKVYENFTKQNNSVIVMEKLYGNNLENVKNTIDSDYYGLLLIKFTMKCILYDRLYHSDLHSGNLFFIKENGIRKLGIIDFGIVDTITKDEQNDFYNFFNEIFINKNIDKAKKYIINNIIKPKNIYDNLTNDKKIELNSDMNLIINKTLINTNHIDHEWIYEINKCLKKYNLHLSTSFCKIQLSFIISDSVGNKLSYNETNINKIIKAINELFCPDVLEF